MELLVKRFLFDKKYTMSRFYINGELFCFGLEPFDASINKNTPIDDIKALKEKYGKIAIPLGKYNLIYNWSNKYKKKLPLVLDTPGFAGVRFHSGNTVDDTLACLLLGKFYKNGWLCDSRLCVNKFIEYWKDKEFEKATVEYKYAENRNYNY